MLALKQSKKLRKVLAAQQCIDRARLHRIDKQVRFLQLLKVKEAQI